MRLLRCVLLCAVCLVHVQCESQGNQSTSPAASASASKALADTTYYVCGDGYRLRYVLDCPADPEADEKYPLLVCLHGKGGGTHAPRAFEQIGGPPCFVLAPSVPPQEFSWSDIRRNGLPYVFELIDDLLETEPIDPDRIYVTGQSMGGFGTFGAVAMRPDFFAASVPVCGGWRTDEAACMHEVPMWIFHGDADKVVPAQYSRDMVKALREAGGTPRYTEYEGVGHNSWVNAYGSEELWVWLFKQRRKPADSPLGVR